MIYDAFVHLPIYGLADLGFVPKGEALHTSTLWRVPNRAAGWSGRC